MVGVNEYQTPRENESVHEGNGSPFVVACPRSAINVDRYGNGPDAGTTSAPAHLSFGGAAAIACVDTNDTNEVNADTSSAKIDERGPYRRDIAAIVAENVHNVKFVAI